MPRVRAGILLLLSVLLAVSFARPSLATTVVPLSFDEIVSGAAEIFIGEVVGVRSRFVDTSDGRAIVTLVTFRVDDGLKGGLQTQTSLEFLGGQVGDVGLVVAGVPRFRVGDRDVLFVAGRNDVSPIVGVMQGRFRIVRDPERGVDTVRTFDGLPLVGVADVGRTRSPTSIRQPAMTVSEFRAAIARRVAGGVR